MTGVALASIELEKFHQEAGVKQGKDVKQDIPFPS